MCGIGVIAGPSAAVAGDGSASGGNRDAPSVRGSATNGSPTPLGPGSVRLMVSALGGADHPQGVVRLMGRPGGGVEVFIQDNGKPQRGQPVDQNAFGAPMNQAAFDASEPSHCDPPVLGSYSRVRSGDYTIRSAATNRRDPSGVFVRP